jgi:putative ABC transport system permease protein
VRAREVVRFAWRGLGANRMRSALTTLGVLIGVGAVILLVAVGNGSAVQIQRNIERLGTTSRSPCRWRPHWPTARARRT